MSGQHMSKKNPSLLKPLRYLQTPYVCPTCTNRAFRRVQPSEKRSFARKHSSCLPSFFSITHHGQRPRRASTSAAPVTALTVTEAPTITIEPATAVHAPRTVPPAFRKLDASLHNFERDAVNYTDTSQLHLAQRSLEFEDAITRVAILGIQDRKGLASLVRVLLADPLSHEAEWERELVDWDGSKALFFKFGEVPSVDDRNPLVRTSAIPSLLLQKHNLEILVGAIPRTGQVLDSQTLIVPSIEIQNSYSGQVSRITYPVHKTLVFAHELGQEVAVDRKDLEGRTNMLQQVIDGRWVGLMPVEGDESPSSPINLRLAEDALASLRENIGQSVKFERAWFNSGMPTVVTWLVKGTQSPSATELKESVADLVTLTLESASARLQQAATKRTAEVTSQSVSVPVRQTLGRILSVWAEEAHTELQKELPQALHGTRGKIWARTRWWKLLWRIDEVGLSAAEVLKRAWLVDAETKLVWMSGRFLESGLLGQTSVRESLPLAAVTELQSSTSRPWALDIEQTRSSLISESVPPLHALAQKLLLQSVSTTLLASAFSAFIYTSISTTSMFEAGTVAALGLVFSLRRLQRRWESAREAWGELVFEEGRRTLGACEGRLRAIIQNGGMVRVDEMELRQQQGAKRAIDDAQQALDELRGIADTNEESKEKSQSTVT